MKVSKNFWIGIQWVIIINLIICVIWAFSGCTTGNRAITKPTRNAGKSEVDLSSRDYQQGFLDGLIFCGRANDKAHSR